MITLRLRAFVDLRVPLSAVKDDIYFPRSQKEDYHGWIKSKTFWNTSQLDGSSFYF